MGKGVRKNRLTNLRVDEVSLVDRPANPAARVVLAKRADDEEADEATIAGGGPTDGDDELEVEPEDVLTNGDEGAEDGAEMALYTEALAESLASIATSDAEDKASLVTKSIEQFTAAVLAKVAPAATDSTTSSAGTSIEKHDSTTETDNMSKEINKAEPAPSPELESVQKALQGVTERLEKAEGRAAALEAEIAKRDRLAKATTLVGNAPVKPEVIAEALEKAGDAKEVEAVIVDLIGKLGEASKAGHIFEEIGKRGETVAAGPEEELEQVATEIRKSAPTLTKEQSIQKALEQRPDLYDALAR